MLMKSLKVLLYIVCFVCAGTSVANAADTSLTGLMQGWAKIQYKTIPAKKEAAFAALSGGAHALSVANPGVAEPLIWEGVIISSYASVAGGSGAIPLMEQARDLLLASININPVALDGLAYTVLGELYYSVPDWPVGFGDNTSAFSYLQEALRLSPGNMDANYFMGDFQLKDIEYQLAANHFQKVINMPDIPGRLIYSHGRKAEAALKLTEAINNL